MSEERAVLRTTLLPSLIEAAAYNISRRNQDLALFEIGNVYHSEEEMLTRLPNEKPRLALLLTGNKVSAEWNRKAVSYDFFDAKGLLENVFERLGLSDKVRYEAAQPEGFHPGRTAAVKLLTEQGYKTIGYVGQFHPDLQRESDLQDTYAAEIELADVFAGADRTIDFKVLARYPASERDIAVVVDRSVTGMALTEMVTATAGELLESVKVFDVYTGERLGADKKSVALALIYRHSERTLTDDEVTSTHGKVVEKLEQSFGAELRK